MGSSVVAEWLPSYLVPFFSLQYLVDRPETTDSFPDSVYYNTGRLDFCLVITCIAVMAVLRDVFRLGVFEPLARWKLMRDLRRKLRQKQQEKARLALNGNGHSHNGNGNGHIHNGNGNGHIHNGNGNGHMHNGNGHTNGSATNGSAVEGASPTRKELRQLERSVLRFAEQGWSMIYYTLGWSYGLYIHRNLPTRVLDPVEVWLGYPHIPIPGPLKFYYMIQIAFYLHQILILNAEARRKDHVQMMTHHIITSLLLIASFFTHFTRVGCLILVLMDWCDIFLPLAKMIRYLDISQLACDTTFAWFLISWFVTRHLLFIIVIKSTIFDAPVYVPLTYEPEKGLYFSPSAYTGFCTMLVSLQIIQMVWFWMICRVAWRVINGSGASDDRSDDEGSEKEE